MAPAHDKKSCINNEKYKYSGKEMSPLGLGIAAEAENVGKQMIGRNGKNWIVALKNQNKVWMRAPEPETLKKEQPILPKKTYVKGSPSGVKHDDEDCSSLDLDKEEDEEEKTPRPTPKTAPKSSSTHSPKKKLMHKTPEPESEEEEDKSEEEEEHKSEEEEHKSEEEEEVPSSPNTKAKAKPTPTPKPKTKAKPKEKEKEVKYETEEHYVKPKRKSHAVKASEFDVGYSKTEEGVTYIVKEGPDNVKKWVKQKEPKSSSSSTTTKKRGPTAYNKFIGKQMIELRKITPGLHTTEYMRLALELWKAMTPEEKAAVKD